MTSSAAEVTEKQGVEYITPQELRARWKGRISVRTLANWRSLGTGPKFTKAGGRVLYPLAEVMAWEADRTAASTARHCK